MSGEDAERLADLLLEWEERQETGDPITAVDLCRDFPELLATLTAKIAALQRVAWVGWEADELPESRYAVGAEIAGRYRLDGLVGEGGQGQVWQGFDTELQRAVAVKVPHPGRATGGLLDEARRVARLRHPGIVPVFDVVDDYGTRVVVSELVDGTDLGKRLAAGPLPVRAAVELVVRVAEALHHAHEQGFVHRDIKPANILVDAAGRPYLTDFGIAAEAGAAGDGSGTLAYMAPEQLFADDSRVDRRADVYALGLVLFHLLTGRRAFPQTDPAVLRQAVLAAEPMPPRKFNRHVPKRVERACLRCLAKSPANRFPTTQSLADDLSAWLGQRRTNWRLVGGMTAVILAIITAAGLISSTRQSDPSVPQPPGRLFVGPRGSGWEIYAKPAPATPDMAELRADGTLVLAARKQMARVVTRERFSDGSLTLRYRLPQPPGDTWMGGHVMIGVGEPSLVWNRYTRVKMGGRRPGAVIPPGVTSEELEKGGVAVERPVGEWNDLRVDWRGNRVLVWLNGQPTEDRMLSNSLAGRIGLASHIADLELADVIYRPLTSD
jgi:hypothetical protein